MNEPFTDDPTKNPSEIKIKGAAILPRFLYLTERAPEAIDEVLARLPEDFRVHLGQGILPDMWYRLDDFETFNRAIDDIVGNGDRSLYVELGRHSADQVLTTIYGAFYQRGNPMYLFERAQPVWNQYYTSGRMEVEAVGDHAVRLSIVDFQSPRNCVCKTVMGWMQRAIEYAGGTDLKVEETECAVVGGRACVLEASWRIPDDLPVPDAD